MKRLTLLLLLCFPLLSAKPLTMTIEVSRFLAKNTALSGSSISVKEVTALNYLVVNLKMNGLWPTTGAIYPMIGTDAISHSLNLLDPETNRITWANDAAGNHTANGWTAASGARGATGILVNGTLANNLTFGFYSRTNSTAPNDGGTSTAADPRLILYSRFTDGNTYYDSYNPGSVGAERTTTANASSNGLIYGLSNGTARAIYRNGSVLTSKTLGTAPIAFPSTAVSIGRDTGQSEGGTGRQYALWFIIPAISAHAEFNTICLNFQTILARNV